MQEKNNFEDFLLYRDITNATKKKNEWIYRKIEKDAEKNLTPVFSVLYQVVAITGARISEALQLKLSDIDMESGLIKIKRVREIAISESGQRRFQIELIRRRRKESAYLSSNYKLYAEIDRMTKEEIESSMSVEETRFLLCIQSDLKRTVIVGMLPKCLLKKIKSLTSERDGYVFRREFTNSNRAKFNSQLPVSRQSAWKNISSLDTYIEYIAKGGLGIMGLSEPLVF
ncbi:hypothetical protein [Pantoea ananatis]|uniref:hypothetical protein n=1 Tax=Pantoea ananas TaxID=553 RepID=UPI003C13EA44